MPDNHTKGLSFSTTGLRNAPKLYKLNADNVSIGQIPTYHSKPKSEAAPAGYSSDPITVTFPAFEAHADTKKAVRDFVLGSNLLNALTGTGGPAASGTLPGALGGATLGGSGGMTILKAILPESADAEDVVYMEFEHDFTIALDTTDKEKPDEEVELSEVDIALELKGTFKASDDDGDSFFGLHVGFSVNGDDDVDTSLILNGEKSSAPKAPGNEGTFSIKAAKGPKFDVKDAKDGDDVKEKKEYKYSLSFKKTVKPAKPVNIFLECLLSASAVTDISIPLISALTNNRTTLTVEEIVLTLDPVHDKKKKK